MIAPAEFAAKLIEQAAAHGVERLMDDESPAPLRLLAPITVAVDFIRAEMADAAMTLTRAERTGGKRVAYTAADMPEAYRAFRSLVGLANT